MKSIKKLFGKFGGLCLCLGLLLPMAATAATPALYSANVPLSEGPSAETAAFQAALKEVFIKVSGQSNIMAQPVIQQAIQQAGDWVVRFQSIVPPVITAGAPPVAWIQVDFDPTRVNSKIQQAGFSVWQGSRGPVLVWLITDYFGLPKVLSENDENQQDWVALFKQAAQARGINVIFPILDLYEGTQLDLFAMRSLNAQALQKASLRYNSTHFLAGHLQGNDDQWQSQWLFSQSSTPWQMSATTKSELVQAAVNRFADAWFSTAPVSVATQPSAAVIRQSDALIITVNNVQTIEALNRIWRGLENLHGVGKVVPTSLTGHTATFELTGVSADSITGSLMELGLVPEHHTEATHSHLYYRYTG